MLDEEQLEQALMAPHSSLISHENHRAELQASLKQALNAQHQNLLNIQTLTYFLHLQLHKKPWSLELRPLLHQALQRISEEPQNEYLHFVLAAFRRKHRNFAALSQHWDHEKQKMRGFITQEIKHSIGICAAPKDWRVAIFMPTYNRLEEFKEAIQCILEQSYSNWEVHIYDDASKDQTEQFAQKIAQSDPRIHYHKNPVNQGFFGIHKSYRHMAEMTQCELITALADDDRWELNHLEKLVHVFQKTPWVAQVYAPMWLVQNKTQIMGQFGPFAHQESILDTQTELDNALVLDMCPVGAIFRSELIAEFAAFDITSQRHFGQSYAAWDYMFHIKLLAHYEMAQYIHPSVHFNIGGSTGSKNWDASEDLFFLLEQLLQDYAKLFDGDHPPTELIHHFVQRRVDGMTRQFHEILRNTQSKQEWDKFVKHQKRIWQQAAQLLETYSLN